MPGCVRNRAKPLSTGRQIGQRGAYPPVQYREGKADSDQGHGENYDPLKDETFQLDQEA